MGKKRRKIGKRNKTNGKMRNKVRKWGDLGYIHAHLFIFIPIFAVFKN